MEKGLIDMNVFPNTDESGYNVVMLEHSLFELGLHPKSSQRHILYATNIPSRKTIFEVKSLYLNKIFINLNQMYTCIPLFAIIILKPQPLTKINK